MRSRNRGRMNVGRRPAADKTTEPLAIGRVFRIIGLFVSSNQHKQVSMSNSLRLGVLGALLCYSLAVAQTRQQAFPPDLAPLTPTADLGLQPVEVEIPQQFGALPPLTLLLPPGFEAKIFAATGLEGPRFMAWSPDGVLHVANMKVDSPSQWSPASDRSSGQIVALPDADGDGVADEVRVVADGFWWAHSLAFYKGDLYVADTNRIYRLVDGDGDGLYEDRQIFIDELPTFHDRGGANHVTKTIAFDQINDKLYVNVGSSCDLCREDDPERASILQFNADGSGRQVFATGMRNNVGLALHPLTNDLWANNNGHDREGFERPPEWISIVHQGGFYGWPLAFGYRKFIDLGEYGFMGPFSAADSALVAGMERPVALVPAHLAPMGLHFYTGDLFPEHFRNMAFAALRGGEVSGNIAGYPGFKVVVVFSQPDGANARVADFMTGLGPGPGIERTRLWGKPVGVTADQAGHLYVSSDHTNSAIIRIGLGPLFGQWEVLPADSLVTGEAATLAGTIRLSRFDAAGDQPVLTADLSALGGSAAEPLEALGDGLYRLSAQVEVAAPNGHFTVPVRLAQNTAAGLVETRLSARLVVLPAADLTLFDESLASGFQVRATLGANDPVVTATGPVFQGDVAGSIAVKPRTASFNWSLSYVADQLVNAVGYQALRFAFRPGTLVDAGSSFGVQISTLNQGRTTSTVELLDDLIDLRLDQWQVVEVPLASFDLTGPIEQIGFSGNWEGTFYLDAVELVRAMPGQAATVVEERQTDQTPADFELGQNYPNPFNSDTAIRFALPGPGPVELHVFNLAGQLVATLVQGQRAAGSYAVRWDGRHDGGRALASGIYLYRLRAGQQVQSHKLLLLR